MKNLIKLGITVVVLSLGLAAPGAAGPFEEGAAPSAPPPLGSKQRVILYEEDATTPVGKRYDGSAVWRNDRIPPAPGKPPEMMIRADIYIPEQRIGIRWSLRRNDDKALPVSHTVEIMFTLPADFPHGGVSNIPGVLMKQGESTRGVPLAGLAVKVTNNFFLIGLSAVDADMQRNIQLLKERSWFDIPVIYRDGKRATIAIEKGTSGERAFADAFVRPPVSPPRGELFSRAVVAKPGLRYDDPWLRAVILAPSVTNSMTATIVDNPDNPDNPGALLKRDQAALMNKPATSLAMAFKSDPYPGIAADRFSGKAVVFPTTYRWLLTPANATGNVATGGAGFGPRGFDGGSGTGTTAVAGPAPPTSSAPLRRALIPLQFEGNVFTVPVSINNELTLNFVLDTGASDVSIPADVVLTLMRTGTLSSADFLGKKTYELADGSTAPSQTFRIKSLKVGDRIIENATGSIAPVNGSLLLGQSFLRRFKSWSIDNQRQVLVLE